MGSIRPFHDFDFGFGQAVEVIDQRVNLAVEAVATVGVEILVLVALGGGQLFFGREHLLHQHHHLVGPRFGGD